MKAIIKYISLLLYSGLIIPFYYYHLPGKKLPADKLYAQTAAKQHKPAKKQQPHRFSLIDDLAVNLFPVLKKLN